LRCVILHRLVPDFGVKFEMTSNSTLRHACFAALLVAFLLATHQTWGTVAGGALTQAQDSQILLVLPVSVLLIYMERKRVFADVHWSPAAAVALLLASGAFFYARRALAPLSQNNSASLTLLFFVVWSVSAFVLCYGAQAFRAARFPLLFLILLVPLPDRLLAWATTVLQLRSTDATCWLYRAARIPYTREGVILVLPKLTIEVAKECSSIRSSLILFISSFVLAHLYLKRFWQKALLPVLAIPVSVAKNAVRIFVLSTLGMYVNPAFLTGRLHHNGGIVFFALGFGVLLLIIWGFHLLERKPGASTVGKAASSVRLG
jgi:exosortase